VANLICHICRDNLAFQKYDGTDLLDEDGSKPCLECIAEAEAQEEDEQ
jgi:hypothetical protein